MRYLANFISLLRNRENRSNEIISPKIAFGKYLANVKFGYCDFFPEPKIALGKDPLYLSLKNRKIVTGLGLFICPKLRN